MLYPQATFMDRGRYRRNDDCTRARGSGQQEYHWMCNGLRIKCLSSGLSWDMTKKYWFVRFRRVRFEHFDELLLAIWAPAGIFVFRHNRSFGVHTNGLSTACTGHSITVRSRGNDNDCVVALRSRSISQKLEDAGC